MKVLVTGGTGFVGPKVVHALRAQGAATCARSSGGPSAARSSPRWASSSRPATSPIRRACAAAVDGCTHVVHLVAILKGQPQDFERVMTQGTRNLLAAATDAGVERFVLMSALGTTRATKDLVPYYGAKWAMEQETIGSGLEYTIFRPSFVFGRDGGALPTFIKQVRYSPVVTVIGSGTQRIQPIWVDDVAEYFARARRPRRTPRTGRSRSAARTSSRGTSSTGRSRRCSASAGASRTFRSRSRAQARG